MSVISEYFKVLEEYQLKYGPNTTVLFQIGSFFECYSVENSKDKIGNCIELSQILNIQLTKKNKNIPEVNKRNPYLIGIPVVSLDKYTPVLLDHNFTVVIVEQMRSFTGSIDRNVTKILSPGCSFDPVRDSNYVCSIYIEQVKSNYIVGMSCIDVSIGNVIIHETFGEQLHVFDKINSFIKAHNATELVFHNKNSDITKDSNMFDLDNILVHWNDCSKPMDINIQNEFLSKVYTNDSILSTIELLGLEQFPSATVSLVYLLDFVFQHNESILNGISYPEIFNEHTFLDIMNNGLYQLNIFSNTNTKYHNTRFKCVFDVVNKTKTVIGKRKLKEYLTFPILDPIELNHRYSLIESVGNVKDLDLVLTNLKKISDLEKLSRKVSLGSLNPFEWEFIVISLNSVLDIYQLISDVVNVPLSIDSINQFLDKYNSIFDYSKMYSVSLDSIKTSFIKPGICLDIDSLQDEYSSLYSQLQQIANDMSYVIASPGSVKIIFSDKNGYTLTTTNVRAANIKKNSKYLNYSFLSNNSGTKITSKEINKIGGQLVSLESKLSVIVKNSYLDILKECSMDLFSSVIDYIGVVDLSINNYLVAKEYHYTKPTLVVSGDSFVKYTGIRHPLSERINESVKYITNDLVLDHSNNIILYSVNGIGKSNLLKSVGVCVILAQAGMFVPCNEMVLCPFTKVIPRIQGGDNILKSQSSFVVELLELKMILKNSDNNCLVLLDELVQSTEHYSGNAIVSTTVLQLEKSKTPFILVSHLNWLNEFEPLKNNPNIKFKHLSVSFDPAGVMTFNRKLLDGIGSTVYGIEIAKSLQFDPEFIKKAFEIRNLIINKPVSLVTTKKSKYNSSKIVSECEICGYLPSKQTDIPNDIHHIDFQCNAGADGVIVSGSSRFHKDSLFNLVTLCKECHVKVHKNLITINGYTQTSNGKKLDWI